MADLTRSEFILGGQRSGKSRRAEMLARQWLERSPDHHAVLIATGQPWDGEMRERIARPQRDRAARVPGMVYARPRIPPTRNGAKVNSIDDSAATAVRGYVTSITLDPTTYQGLVALDVNKGIVFPKDSSAKILTAGLLGDQYIGIEPGGDEKNLAAGDVITQTQSAVVLENLISQFLFNKAAEPEAAASKP